MTSFFRFQGSISRAPYLAVSTGFLLTQYLVHGLVYASHIDAPSGFLTFMLPAPAIVLGLWIASGWQSDPLVPLLIAIVDVVIAWVLLASAIRRARTTSQSLLLACLAIVPIIQIPTILWLAGAETPGRNEVPIARNRVSLETALKGLIAGVVITVVLEVIGTLVFRTYGVGLFLASPFIVGCVTAYLGNRRSDIGSGATARLVLGACFLGAVGLLAVAVEGVVCLALASPLIAAMAWLGGLVGRTVALKGPGAVPGRTAMSIAVLPVCFLADFVAPPRFAFESVESVEVAATDRTVWDAVVHMGPIPTPPPAPFRWGLAYPMRGIIHGTGVGAIREGVFSTGVAYERVTEWDPPKQLSFIVLSDPPTMRELSPYRNVHAPHVSGYFRTLDARFTIVQLENGHVLLSLATRHELDLNPAFYWLPIAKWAVHTNKERVLAHFAQQAEAAAAGEGARYLSQ
jgi:hypothetical protein